MLAVDLTPEMFFTPGDGIIARVKPDFSPRVGQLELSELILDLTNDLGQHLLAEAPTGFGKSFAGLVPVIIKAVAQKKRIVISTETIALQDQYVGIDLPLLQRACKAFGINFTFAVAKGRSNYICRMKLDEDLGGDETKVGVTQLKRWAMLQQVQQHTGDITSVPFEMKASDWRDIGADEDCERKACPFYGEGKKGHSDCFIYEAQRRYAEAQIIVTNHTLFLLDAQLGNNGILGPYDLAIIDEGHTIPEQAQKCWGMEFRPRTVSNTLRLANKMIRRAGVNHFEHGFLEPYQELEDRVFNPFQPLVMKGGSYYLRNIRDSIIHASKEAAQILIQRLVDENRLLKQFTTESESNPVVDAARTKISKLVSGLRHIYGDEIDEDHKDNWIAFLEVQFNQRGHKHGVLHLKPIDVAPLIKGLLLDVVPNIVFMSATMRINNSFYFMRRELGLSKENCVEFTGETPFNYREQVEGYFPTDLPDADEEDYIPRLAKRIKTIINRRGGKALVLFTSNKTMEAVYDIVSETVQYDCLMQGQASKARLVQQFKDDVGSCLFATRSFFTGVDIPGEACSIVILTKAPFRVPTDPLFKSKCEKIKERGGNDFADYSMPLMLMDVQQAFGRLIRSVNDKGLFCFLDSRANKKAYGARIRQSLPKIRYIEKA